MTWRFRFNPLILNALCPPKQVFYCNAVPFIAPGNAEEVVQDGIAMAARMIHNAEQAGKKVVRCASGRRNNTGRKVKEVTAGNIAYYGARARW